MNTPMQRVLALVLSALTVGSGCSVAFVNGPHVEAGKVTCTEEMKFPIIDAAAAVVLIAAPFIQESQRDRQAEMGFFNEPHPVISIGMWAGGLAAAISAIYGVRTVKRCRRSIASQTLTAPAAAPMPAPNAPTGNPDPAPPPPAP
jgi:hypothetical protein